MAKLKPIAEWTRAEIDAARSILLEVSPFEADDGELIGRDPRKVPVEDYQRAGIEANPILKAVRAKCMDCSGEQEAEVRKCVMIDCVLWPFRMGSNPFFKREFTDEQRAAQAERGRAALKRLRAASEPVTLTSENPTADPAATPAPDEVGEG